MKSGYFITLSDSYQDHIIFDRLKFPPIINIYLVLNLAIEVTRGGSRTGFPGAIEQS